ncbi:MAG: VPLPA-CTERM sorting domain-containing protein [Parvularculaceae bacterium]|nr:VPLPA-CTERM sorting domain-containing protein [Parvularculaceae bacterium]
MKNVLGVIAGFAALAFVNVASATTISVANPNLGTNGGTAIQFGDVSNGVIPAGTQTGAISVAAPSLRFFNSNLTRQDGITPLIQNLVVEFRNAANNALIQSYSLTNAAGVATANMGQSFVFSLGGASSFYARITGTSVVSEFGELADLNFSVQAVPVPAALPLMMAGLAGLGFASRRRKIA